MRTQPNFWTAKSAISTLLLPLAWLYGLGSMLHRKFTKPETLHAPVISIGNITAGGAGKTPTTIMLAHLLQEMGKTPHILSRGYGATIATPIRVATQHHHTRQVGDEALLLAKHAPTWVFPSRFQSGIAAIAAGADILLCDDGLQHYALSKDVNLLVIDGAYGVGNGRYLPAGPLRESLAHALTRCDAVILIGQDKHHLRDKITLPIFNASIRATGDTNWLKGTHVIAFAGIARPQKFYDTLLELGAVLSGTFSFADHHHFSEKELALLNQSGAMLVTTEKDWVRLPAQWQTRIRYVPVALHLEEPAALRQWLEQKLYA
ncbi:MAG: tetraacyldisaccharide 4'-kinase [Alphaproteobacteria bacterium]|nr:tetraacyldisaccharide 4'-kinase [Alphaproteobacteria bacterium]